MFENLMQFFKGKEFLDFVFDDFKKMLVDSEEMFNSVIKALLTNDNTKETKLRIYDIDKNVNQNEKDIRRRIVEHLTLQPSVDIPTSLLLMSVVKDAERIGDYCKDSLELQCIMSTPLDVNTYNQIFNGLENEIKELFTVTKSAFLDSNEDKAKKTWEMKKNIATKCTQIIHDVANSSYSANEAVFYALLARYFKRISSHLTNIATSVILPISNLDYYDEKRKSE